MIAKENTLKEERVRRYLEDKGFDFVLLTRRDHFAWLTCGGLNHIPLFTEVGCVSLLIGARGERFVLANRIEAPRLDEENIGALEYEAVTFPWFEEEALKQEVLKKTGSGKVAADVGMEGFEALPDDFWKLRNPLLPGEVDRYRQVGYDASEALREAAHSVGPGFKEYEIEAIIASSCLRRQLRPSVILVAAEDRIDKYRHPLSKETPFHDRLMLVLCAERHGMIANLTRFLYSRSIPRKLDRLHETVARIDAAVIAASRPGKKLGDVFQVLVQAYEQEGFSDEWHLHHQGGPTGYQGRDLIVTPGCEESIVSNMALAWNPSITGVKSEDTILVTDKGFEIITRGEGWNYLPFEVDGKTVERPWPMVI